MHACHKGLFSIFSEEFVISKVFGFCVMFKAIMSVRDDTKDVRRYQSLSLFHMSICRISPKLLQGWIYYPFPSKRERHTIKLFF
jgi:hypothetical protein